MFEQSGTFKREFQKLGWSAYDYDILNDYGETDYQIDLFAEIENAYDGKESIFDSFKSEDLLMAFFPCVRFEDQILMHFRGDFFGVKDKTIREKMQYCMKLMSELRRNYDLVNKLFIICMDRKLRLVMENPYSEQHFLRRYWCYKPSIIDRDRTEDGDYFKKPTQYWFLNTEPKYNLVFEPIEYNRIGRKNAIATITNTDAKKMGAKNSCQARSMIHPQYANRFIRKYILDEE